MLIIFLFFPSIQTKKPVRITVLVKNLKAHSLHFTRRRKKRKNEWLMAEYPQVVSPHSWAWVSCSTSAGLMQDFIWLIWYYLKI